MKYFKRLSRCELAQMEANLINRCLGATYQPVKSHRLADRALCERVAGPAVRLETKRAYGSRIPCKGGVIHGRRAFE